MARSVVGREGRASVRDHSVRKSVLGRYYAALLPDSYYKRTLRPITTGRRGPTVVVTGVMYAHTYVSKRIVYVQHVALYVDAALYSTRRGEKGASCAQAARLLEDTQPRYRWRARDLQKKLKQTSPCGGRRGQQGQWSDI
jgi:hypothetical protein